MQTSGAHRDPSKMKRVAFAAFLGTALEWYDFFIYGAVAALVFNKIFFPSFDPMVGILFSFATFAVGFIARPLGALIFGHMGDTVGRKKVLIITMLLMGGATVGIGLLPTYDQIGVFSTVLLIILRIIQGLALGGEWGGAVLMTAEHGDAKRKGYHTSFAQIGVPIGNLLSVGVLAMMTLILNDEQFLSWGWRVPFILSIVLILVGLWVRGGIDESPEFKALSETNKAKKPLITLLKSYPRQLLTACFIRIGTDVAFYIFSLFVLTYVSSSLGLPKSVSLNAVLIASAIQIAVIPLVASLSDRIGRKPVFLVGSVGGTVWAFVFFSMLDTRDPMMITVAVCVAMTCWALMYGPLAAFITELFPTQVRYSGISLGFQLAGILGGGIAPLIATSLLREFQTPMAVAWYVAGALALTTLSILLSREAGHSQTDIRDAEAVS